MSKKPARMVQAQLHYPSHLMSPEDLLTFVETPPFSRRLASLNLTDDDLAVIQCMIMVEPRKHPVIEGTGGLRKMRCARQKNNRGKSDGYRVCYVYFEEFHFVLLVLIYAKNELDNLPDSHNKAYRQLIARAELELQQNPKRFGAPKPADKT